MLGALFLGVIVNALPVVKSRPFWQIAISGAVIVVAVVVNSRSGRGRKNHPRRARREAAGASGAAAP